VALNGCTSTVQFVTYSELNTNNDLHLATNDTACTGQGTNLSGYFGANFDGASRSNAGPWNIGAY